MKTSISRRRFLGALAAATGVGILSACSTGQPASPTAQPQSGAATPTGKTKILWWSHWAEEEPRKKILNSYAKKFSDANPNVEIEIVWWQKAEMFPAMRNAFTAGSGFPDIFYFDYMGLEFIQAGWLADLTNLDWSQVETWAKPIWKYPGPGGKEGIFAIPLEVTADEIYYNKTMFEQNGVKVPANYQFSADEYLNICKKFRTAGIDPLAQGIGDRPYIGTYPTNFALLAQMGEQPLIDLWKGKRSWDDPEVKTALTYVKSLIDVPVMPATFSTMKLSESHIYFHTQQKAAMFEVGSWYTGRAFSPPDKGGQPADFKLGFLRYPAMPNGKGNDYKFLTPGGSIAVAEKSSNKKAALDLAQSIMTVDAGNTWVGISAIGTGVKTDVAKIDSPFKWYFDEQAKTHEGQKWVVGIDWQLIMPAVMKDAYTAVVNQGFPLGKMSIDQVISEMEAARAKVK
ncbi:MAG: ABC transporter substrate-binding protein [Chloroflexota bacterium]